MDEQTPSLQKWESSYRRFDSQRPYGLVTCSIPDRAEAAELKSLVASGSARGSIAINWMNRTTTLIGMLVAAAKTQHGMWIESGQAAMGQTSSPLKSKASLAVLTALMMLRVGQAHAYNYPPGAIAERQQQIMIVSLRQVGHTPPPLVRWIGELRLV